MRAAVTTVACVAASGVALAAVATALLAPLTGLDDAPPAAWRFGGLPNQRKPATRFAVETIDGARALRVEADGSYGNLVHALDGAAADAAGRTLAWRWRIEVPNAAIDLRTKAGDDTEVKVCTLWDLPLDAVPFGERQLMRLARAAAGQKLPAATVCYVRDARLDAGTVLPSPFTRRLRYVVLNGRGDMPSAWRDERRDIAADLRRAFADDLERAAGELPPLAAVAVGADADNTGGRSVAHVAALTLQ